MNTSPTFTFAMDERIDEQRAISAQINAHHHLVKSAAKTQQIAQSEQAIRLALAALKKSNQHRRPEWLWHALSAEAELSFGNIPEAIRLATEALKHIPDFKDERDVTLKAKTMNNLSEYHRQAGKYSEAVAYGREAYSLSKGRNLGIVITWAEALYMDGQKQLANSVLQEVAKVSNINEPGDVLGTHLRFEEDLRRMVDLPIVKTLMARLA